jgi:transposase InsO family protein
MMVNRATMNHQSRRDPQTALKMRLRELAANRVRFGYRRLTVMLRREGWAVNAKRIYRLYTADGLAVRTKVRKKIARSTMAQNFTVGQWKPGPISMVYNWISFGRGSRWK